MDCVAGAAPDGHDRIPNRYTTPTVIAASGMNHGWFDFQGFATSSWPGIGCGWLGVMAY
jgi:hypothetical protein